MDDVFGSSGFAAADQQRQEEINRRIGLDAYDDDDTHEKREDSEYKSKIEV